MSFREKLEARSSDWVSEGLISSEQRAAIIARTQAPAEGVLAGRLVPGLAILGAIVVVLGLFLVVSANWDEVPSSAKFIAGVVLLIAFQGGGYWLAFGPLSRRNTGTALMLVGSGVILGDLALIAQQFNVESNPSRLILLAWLLGLAAMPYLLRSRVFAFVSTAVLVAGLAVEVARDGSPIEVDGLAGIITFVAVGVGLAAYGAAHRLSRLARLAAPIEVVAVGLVFGLVYVLGFYRHYVDGFGEHVLYETAAAWLLIGVPALLLVAVLIAWIASRHPRLADRSAWPLAAAAAAGGGVLAYVAVVLAHPRESEEQDRIVWTIGFWMASLTLSAVLIWLGVSYRRSWWTNAALGYLGLFVITRYFDTFGSYAQTGVLFVGGGLLLLVIAFTLERMRRQLTALSERPA